MSTTAFTDELMVDAPARAQLVPAGQQETDSYGEILRSSALVGGSQAMNLAIGVMRNKAMALFLGPAGFGLAGIYNAIAELAQNIAGIGVNSSGVRQIAEAAGSNDTSNIAQTAAVLRRTSLVLGVVGAALIVVASRQISALSFGTPDHHVAIAALSLAVFCKLVAGGQTALIQGMRRIRQLAKMQVFSSLLGAVTGVALVYVFRDRGIVAYVIAIAASTVLTSWWYSRQIRLPKRRVTFSEMGHEAAALLKLGVAFMISSMMTMGVAYAVRVIVLRKIGVAGTGYYQSAWTLGGMYVSFILQAMAADFYPRLTASINDHRTCNRLVNEQARIGMLLAGPGVVATLTLAPLVILALYSSKFGGSVAILRWICLGTMLQVVTWPMGFIIVAKGLQNLFIFCEVAWGVVSLALASFCIDHFGIAGAGIAFFLSYVFHAILIYPVVRRLSGFRWSADNQRTGFVFGITIAAVMGAVYYTSTLVTATVGIAAVIATSIYSLRVLSKIVSVKDVPRLARAVFGLLGVARFRASSAR